MEIRPYSPRDRRFAALSAPDGRPSLQTIARAAETLQDMRDGGEEAWRRHLLDSGQPFDANFKVGEAEISDARNLVSEQFLTALSLARVNIRKYHEFQRNRGYLHDDGDGVSMEREFRPLAGAGILCGKSYSALLMATVPAQVAGVGEIAAAATAGENGEIDPHILATAAVLGIDAVYRMSGVPAVAAFAFGFGGVPKVDKIVGPGGEMAAAAKRAVSGHVGVDGETYPRSQVFLADASANARLIAMDLLGLAENAGDAGSILVFATDRLLAEAIRIEADRLADAFPDGGELLAVLNTRGGIFVFPDLDAAIDACNRLAPSRVFLMTGDDEEALPLFDNAGIIHTGIWTPEACGEYLAGANALIPAAGAARFANGLGVEDFLVPTAALRYDPRRLLMSGRHAALMAEAEGRRAAAAAVRERLELLRIVND